MNNQDYIDALQGVPMDQLFWRNLQGQVEYATAVHELLNVCLENFDPSIYRAYVDKGEFRQELLDLRQGEAHPNDFSKEDLQLFLMIQQKAEDVATGQIAHIIHNTILIKVARILLAS